jgi:hypothetical protein
MQNRYTGDIGDFGKLGLLRVLATSGLSIGVNWYLTPDEHHNGDGRHVKYLNDEGYRSCDDPLWLRLKQIVESGQREIFTLQNKHLLDAAFYPALLDFTGKSKPERNQLREEWHAQALNELVGIDVVFVDPDNGLIVPSAVETAKENKYVKPEELADYYNQGSSIIYYQHKARRPDSFYIEQHKRLIQSGSFEDATGFSLKFRTTSQRYYFFIVQAHHRAIIEAAAHDMLSSAWRNHFCVL